MRRLQGHQIEGLAVEQVTVPEGTPDGYAPVVVGGELVYVEVPSADTVYMPLTTTVGGVPELVWSTDDSLIPTEVPL